jgi:hypothetical protein
VASVVERASRNLTAGKRAGLSGATLRIKPNDATGAV